MLKSAKDLHYISTAGDAPASWFLVLNARLTLEWSKIAALGLMDFCTQREIS